MVMFVLEKKYPAIAAPNKANGAYQATALQSMWFQYRINREGRPSRLPVLSTGAVLLTPIVKLSTDG